MILLFIVGVLGVIVLHRLISGAIQRRIYNTSLKSLHRLMMARQAAFVAEREKLRALGIPTGVSAPRQKISEPIPLDERKATPKRGGRR